MDVRLVSSGFFELVCDSSFAYLRAKHTNISYEENRFARCSILSSALCVESFANCTISSLVLSKNKRRELSKGSTLRKLDPFLEVVGATPIDKERGSYVALSEIVQARNEFVHPRESSVEGELAPAAREAWRTEETPEYDVSLRAESWPALGFPKNPTAWRQDEAHNVLSRVCDYLTGFVRSLDQLHAENVKDSLATRFEVSNISSPVSPQNELDELHRLKSSGIDFGYLARYELR